MEILKDLTQKFRGKGLKGEVPKNSSNLIFTYNMATELAKLIVRKTLAIRTSYVPLAKETIQKTKYELFLLFSVSLHEFTYWKINKN